MNLLQPLADTFAAFVGSVATSIAALRDRTTAPAALRLAEQANGTFASADGKGAAPIALSADAPVPALRGRRVELTLAPSRFFFRPLELPRRATDFIKGVIQAQIDRITPWSADEALFGWSTPADIANDRISVTVAAAARAQIAPFVQAAAASGAKSVVVSTELPDGSRVEILNELGGGRDAGGIRRALVGGLAGMAFLAALAVGADLFLSRILEAQHNNVAQRIAERRGVLRAGGDAQSNSALARLEKRKNEMPAAVIVVEALSKVLPDRTYVTELRVEGTKLQIVGITDDAPALIRLIEASPHFSRATFFAPTTRAPNDPGDRFHIEAQIKPVFSPAS